MNFRQLIYQSVLWRGFYFASVLALNIMIARYYEAEYSGLIYFVVNSFAFIVIVVGFSLEAGIGYYVVSGKAESPPLANFAIGWTIIATIVALLVLSVLNYFNLIAISYAKYYFAAICYIGGCMLVNFFTSLFYAKKDFLTPNFLMAIVNLVLIVLIPFSSGDFFSKELFVKVYFAGFLLQGLLLALLFYILNKREWIYRLPGKQILTPVFKYALHAFWANAIFFLLYRIDYWFVEKYCTEKDLGNYIQVSKLVQLFLVLPAIIASAVFPMSATGDKEALHRGLSQLSRILVFSYTVVCLLLAITGYWLFPWVYGVSFDNMFLPFILVIPGIICLSTVSLLSAYFAGQDKVWINLVGSLGGLLIVVAGNLLFTPIGGVVAAAAVSSAGYLVVFIALIFFYGMVNKTNWTTFLFLKKVDIHLIESLAARLIHTKKNE